MTVHLTLTNWSSVEVTGDATLGTVTLADDQGQTVDISVNAPGGPAVDISVTSTSAPPVPTGLVITSSPSEGAS